MCDACEQHGQPISQCLDASEIAALARKALEMVFHFPSVLNAAAHANPFEQRTLRAMIFTALGIARIDERMNMVEERAVVAGGAIATTYFFPATQSRLAIARRDRNSFFVLDFSFEWPASSRRQMLDLEQWMRDL